MYSPRCVSAGLGLGVLTPEGGAVWVFQMQVPPDRGRELVVFLSGPQLLISVAGSLVTPI